MNCWENLPALFRQRLMYEISKEKLNEILESFCFEKPVSIRINTLKTNKEFVKKSLSLLQILYKEVLWYNDALILPKVGKSQITETTLYKQGLIYIQSLSSMIPALVLQPQPDDKILDLTAAPGSKTTQIAQMINNLGAIVANDISRQRMYRLQTNLQQQGITNVSMSFLKGEHIWKKYPNYFDKVLVDVPCSMEGRFLSQDPSTWKDWSIKKGKILSSLQKQLLRSAFYAAKPGGTIVYSTCTLAPEENEEVIQWLYEKEEKHMTIEKIYIANLKTDKAISSWKNKIFTDTIKNTIRIYPSESMEGFFIAKIKRLS